MSKLQNQASQILSVHLGRYTIRENHRPEWLQTTSGMRLELDFYIPDLNVAFEIQGRQHYEFVRHFHIDYDGFKRQLERDRIKREICARMGVVLYEASTIDELRDCITKIHPTAVNVSPHPIAVLQSISAQQVYNSKKAYTVSIHPETIKKHLNMLWKILSHKNNVDELTPRDIARIRVSLRAIMQYQNAKGVISFDETGLMLLRSAQECLRLPRHY